MTLAARVERRDRALVVTLRGAVERDALSRLEPDLPSDVTSGCDVVLDLDEVTLLDAAGLRDVFARLRRSCGTPLVVVCRRSTGRRLLHTWGLDRGVTLTTSLDAALRRAVPRSGAQPGRAATTAPS